MTTIIAPRVHDLGGGFNVPVCVGGVAVNPGDAVLADDCGVVVIEPRRLQKLIEVALADQAEEGGWIDRLRKGERLQDLVDIRAMLEKNGMEGTGV